MPLPRAGSIMYCRCGHESVVITPSHTGEGWGGVRCLLHATCRAECGGNGREDGDDDVEDLAPSAVVVECSHSEIIG